jgi:two-component system OmpR family sensor kinase
MRLPSIRQRLSRALLAALLGWGLLAVPLVGLVMVHAVDAVLDSTMQESTEILYGLVQPLAQQTEGPLRIMPRSPHDERLVWQVISSRGPMQARSVSSPTEPLATRPVEGFSDHTTPDGTAWRVYSIRVDDDGSMLHVAQRMSDRYRQQMQVAMLSLGTALLLGLGTSAWLARRVRLELTPLLRMAEAVQRHDPLQSAQMPAADRSELVPIRAAVMALGRRLSDLVERERAFSAHAAHTLRTPLAGMDAQLAVALQESSPAARPRLVRTREALARLNLVLIALLNLFRSDRSLQLQQVDVAALIVRWPVAGLAVEVDQRAALSADPELLTAALFNLLDNAQRYGARHALISVLPDTGSVRVRVADDGAGIGTDALAQLQRAIDSGATSSQLRLGGGAGLGLGLTMANLVARAHHGGLRLVATEVGTCVEMSFGVASDVKGVAS